MERVIVDTDLRKVIYNSENKTYTKIIKCKLKKRIKFFLKIRKYPGENIKYISELFRKNGIKALEVLEYSKYKVVTKEITGKTFLEELILNYNNYESKILIEKYITMITKIINLGVYFGDFNFGNFIVHNKELYAIDLEDYRKDFFSKFRRKSLLKRLKRELRKNEKILKNVDEDLNGEKIYLKIEEKLKNMI